MREMTVIELFKAKFTPEPNSGCWLWEAAVSADGYGKFWDGEQMRGAHRFAYKNCVSPIPEGMCVLHRCDVRVCVNPAHLFLGTRADNAADRDAKGRQSKGEAHINSKLTNADILTIRAATGQTQKQLAARFGVSQSQISSIRSRKTWAHV